MTQQQKPKKGIEGFFRSLLQTFISSKKKVEPLPGDIPAPIVLPTEEPVTGENENTPPAEEKAQKEQLLKEPTPIIEKRSAAENYQLGLECFELHTQEDHDSKAFEYFQKAALQEHPQSQSYLAYMYRTGYGVPKDSDKSFQWGLKAAQHGIADAQYHTGLCYLNAWGTGSSAKEALVWLTKAAEQNIVEAHRTLGDIYSGDIQSLEPNNLDLNTAEQHYLKASHAGETHAQVKLAKIYLSNQYGKKDLALAKQYLEYAAQENNEEAQYLLGMQYLLPEKGNPDYQKASDLLYQAAQNGWSDAMFELGNLYAKGHGVEKNETFSKRYYELAAAAGNRFAKQKLFEDFDIFSDDISNEQHERVSVRVKLI